MLSFLNYIFSYLLLVYGNTIDLCTESLPSRLTELFLSSNYLSVDVLKCFYWKQLCCLQCPFVGVRNESPQNVPLSPGHGDYLQLKTINALQTQEESLPALYLPKEIQVENLLGKGTWHSHFSTCEWSMCQTGRIQAKSLILDSLPFPFFLDDPLWTCLPYVCFLIDL